MKLHNVFLSLVTLISTQSFATEGPYLGVVNKADGTASFINLLTHQTDFAVSVGFLPHEITFSPDGRWAFVSNYGKDHVRSQAPTNRPGHNIAMIDMEKRQVAKYLDLGAEACAPHGLEASPDGKRLYVTCEARKVVMVIDLASAEITEIPTMQEQSHMVVFNTDETRAYTSNFASGSISVLDLTGKSSAQVIPTGPGTEGISLSGDGKFIYASSVLGNFIVKIDAATLEIIGRVETGKSPVRVVPTPDGEKLIVNCAASNVVQVFDAATMTLMREISVGRQPIGIVVPNNDYVFTATMLENAVVMINLKTYKIEHRFATGNKPDGIAFGKAR
ncbi:beta-propeller fold lactonase family protein [Bdellovibrio sp. HCB2-146]|uniref:YncE family protein n=1 Tax=Bdellovibrio sp. HCB2-146 TaxID=3394362 RepID=UPI0039BCDA70